jgi:CMP-N,N'-diacetyllegionaminic acid synthase
MVLAIIPARFGSKGIRRKNIVDFCGKPLIQYSIEAAIKSKYIDEILITSNDDDVIELAFGLGINTSYRRPDELATDSASMVDVIKHALEWFKNKRNQLPDSIIILQPTSPLRVSSDIDNALRLFKKAKVESLVSVHKVSEHPYECIKSNSEIWTYLEYPKQKVFRRQDYEQDFFFINGAIYLLSTKFFLENNTFIDKGRSFLFEMPKERGVDIDTQLDLEIAKCIFLSDNFK